MAAPSFNSLAGERGFLDELRRRAAVTPDALALIEPERESLTFARLQNRIQAVADAVTGAGVRREDVVALVLPDGAGLITSFLGVASVAICAPVNPALRKAEIESVVADLEARAVILDPMLSSPAEAVARKRGIDLLNIQRCASCSEHALAEPANDHH